MSRPPAHRGAWLFTGGARLDGWKTSDASCIETVLATVLDQHPGADRSGAVPTGRIGVRRDLDAGLYLRAAAYAGFRAADAQRAAPPVPGRQRRHRGQPGLTPERLYGVEAGFGGQGAADLGRRRINTN